MIYFLKYGIKKCNMDIININIAINNTTYLQGE